MERGDRVFYSFIQSKFFNRIPRFQNSGVAAKKYLKKLKFANSQLTSLLLRIQNAWEKRDAEKTKLLRGIGFLFLAIAFGWVSLQASQEKGRLLFARTHWPAPFAWNETLHSLGLKQPEQLASFTALFKTLPDAFSDSSDIWANENGCYVYLAKSPFEHRTSAEFWTCSPALPPLRWVNLGSGIEGFDRLLEFLNKNRPKFPQILAKKAALRRNLIDPKEIRY